MEKKIKIERDMKIKYQSLLSKKTKHKCSWKNCNKKSISSHSISKSTLKLISDNNKIISPDFNIIAGAFNPKKENTHINMKFKKIGLNQASTFNGFCKEDDNSLFTSIDNFGIQTYKDIFLQLYRTGTKFSFSTKMTNISELEVYGKENYSNQKFEENKIVNLNDILLYLENSIEKIPNNLLKSKEILNMNPFLPMQIIYTKVNIHFPVALEKYMILSENDLYYDGLFLVIPRENHTNILILCHNNIVSQYLKCLESNIKILNLIESMMILDSLFYLNPKVFSSWSEEKINILEQDFYFCQERKFLEEYNISIFNDIRLELCKNLPDNIKKYEMKKINNIPNSSSVHHRLWRMRLKTEEERIKKLKLTKGC